MAKNSIRDFSATAASNTDIQSVDIDENCAASGINTSTPASTPSSSGFLFVESGALKYKGSSGTVTTLASA